MGKNKKKFSEKELKFDDPLELLGEESIEIIESEIIAAEAAQENVDFFEMGKEDIVEESSDQESEVLSLDSESELENETVELNFDDLSTGEDELLSLSSEEEIAEELISEDGLDLELSSEENAESEFKLELSSEEFIEPPTQVTDDEAISIIESLLFISDRPVGLTTFKNAFENTTVNTKKIKELINELKIDFVQTRRGVSLEEVDGSYQLRTKPDNQDFIKKILKPKIFKLTGPSLETLSVIAYKQPCVKSQVDEVRGVESGHLIRALMDKGLVAFDGKSDFPGRPMLYKTTRKFLEIFGLRNLSELPSLSEIEELLPEGIGEDEDKQTLTQLADKLEESFEAESYSVGEEELGKITEQLSGISTETEFFEIEKQKQRESRDRDRAEGIREALILGDAVDPKDQRWLERYEAKLNAKENESVAEGESTEAGTEVIETNVLASESNMDTDLVGDNIESELELAEQDLEITEDLESENEEPNSSSDLDSLIFSEEKTEKSSKKKSKDNNDLSDLVEDDPLDLL